MLLSPGSSRLLIFIVFLGSGKVGTRIVTVASVESILDNMFGGILERMKPNNFGYELVGKSLTMRASQEIKIFQGLSQKYFMISVSSKSAEKVVKVPFDPSIHTHVFC